MIDEQMTQQCCLLVHREIQYRQPGDQVLYHQKEATVKCKRGWTGENCDLCTRNFGPEGQCNQCLTGWIGDSCNYCEGFGFSTESNCTECIHNGYWKGTFRSNYLDVHLTFTGETCSELVPGKYTTTLHQTCFT